MDSQSVNGPSKGALIIYSHKLLDMLISVRCPLVIRLLRASTTWNELFFKWTVCRWLCLLGEMEVELVAGGCAYWDRWRCRWLKVVVPIGTDGGESGYWWLQVVTGDSCRLPGGADQLARESVVCCVEDHQVDTVADIQWAGEHVLKQNEI